MKSIEKSQCCISFLLADCLNDLASPGGETFSGQKMDPKGQIKSPQDKFIETDLKIIAIVLLD
jgi:hypothetical protein